MKTVKPIRNMMIVFLSTIFIFACSVSLSSAQSHSSLSELDQSEYFDFWVGQWDLTWQASDGSTETGENTIERVLNGKVIKENFEATSGQMNGFKGKSYSVYNAASGKWKQTWVDNSGGYLDFIGKVEGDKRIFIRESKDAHGNVILQRMVFYDITEDSFSWDWEKSTDNGKIWQLQWKIAYRRH